MYYCGIDYHKKYSVASVLNEAGEIIHEGRIQPNHPDVFEAFFKGLDGPVRVVFECGLNWGYLYDLLTELAQVESVVLAHPYHTRLIAEAQIKTDKLDAQKLAWLLRGELISSVYIPDEETRRRKDVIRQRVYWVKTRTQIKNRIHRILERQRELEMPQCTDLFGKRGLEALDNAILPEPDHSLLKQNLTMHRALSECIRENEKSMRAAGSDDPMLHFVMSICGIGWTTGSIIVTEIDEISRFRNASKLCGYAGLVPTTHSSGGKTHHGRMLTGCNKWLKWAFIESAWVAVGRDPYFGALYKSHRARGKKANTAITIVARRMCRIVFELMKEERCYEVRALKPQLNPAALRTG